MGDKELNIKSSTIDKGLDLAKDFLGKLIGPSVEELGLLISEPIKFLRFKNQIKILLKARQHVERYNISLKEIPIKILVPLLENASLEEDQKLQDKWANMITNMADTNTNLQNQIFPHILSQISTEEYEGLRDLLAQEHTLLEKQKILVDIQKDKPWEYNVSKLRKEIIEIEQCGFSISVEAWEYSNLERLGLIRLLPPQIYINEFTTGGVEYEHRERWHSLKAEYQFDNGYRITELGEKFLEICEMKQSKQ